MLAAAAVFALDGGGPAGPRTGFERSLTGGLTAPTQTGNPRAITFPGAPEGRRVLRLPRSSAAQWVQHTYPAPIDDVEVSFSYRRPIAGRQVIFSLPTNGIAFADDGRGALIMIRSGETTRPVAEVGEAGAWNHLTLTVDASADRLRAAVRGEADGGWIDVPLGPERALRFGGGSLANGPLLIDAINLDPRADAQPPAPNPNPEASVELTPAHAANLELIRSASVRNANHDDSPDAAVPSALLEVEDHLGPRADYLEFPGGNSELASPVPNGGQFRAGCEFSHFAYDDPLVHPGRPGASHLHMFFGNTDANAFSTYKSLIDSGSSTCNGQELNRTGYWVPAMFDGAGNVRIPERIVVYYKGQGLGRENAEPYPEGAALLALTDVNAIGAAAGGARDESKFSFVCSDNFSDVSLSPANVIPDCDGDHFRTRGDERRVVLEMNVKFPQCWNGRDPTDPSNFRIPVDGGWYYSGCGGEFPRTLPNLEYFVNYAVEPGERTGDWFLASDVVPTADGHEKARGGSTVHGDWWGAWHRKTNERWIEECATLTRPDGTPSGCGFGYLSDGGPDREAPWPGPALKHRPQYTGPTKVPAARLHGELCPRPSRPLTSPEDAAWCAPTG